MGKLIPECPPMWVTAVLYGGPFAASLRLLLQNDSVMDIGSKGRIYGELLRLLNVLGMLPSAICHQCVTAHSAIVSFGICAWMQLDVQA